MKTNSLTCKYFSNNGYLTIAVRRLGDQSQSFVGSCITKEMNNQLKKQQNSMNENILGNDFKKDHIQWGNVCDYKLITSFIQSCTDKFWLEKKRQIEI